LQTTYLEIRIPCFVSERIAWDVLKFWDALQFVQRPPSGKYASTYNFQQAQPTAKDSHPGGTGGTPLMDHLKKSIATKPTRIV
jgi:hypothetical protein